jgi:mono/diheme cytochrome c family protein
LNCAACHGAEGSGVGGGNLAHLHGDGADLTGRTTVEQTDGDLKYWIENGAPGTDMPAFSPALTGDEAWQLVLYIRQLQEAASVAAEAAE